jgi:hypothetical protein
MRVGQLFFTALFAAISTGLIACGSDSSGPLPPQNPTLLITVTPSGTTMYAGDSLIISLDASDSTDVRKIHLASTRVGVQGVVTYEDNVDAGGAYHVQRSVRLRIPDGPLASNTLTYTVGVVPTVGATIAANSVIITVLDTVTVRRVGTAFPTVNH